MTERAKVLGGTLQASRRPDGGYCVRAWLPADSVPAWLPADRSEP
jgi:hypothetical protein